MVRLMRRASSADIDELLAIERSCAEAPHWSEEVWRRLLTEDESGENLRACFIAQDANSTAGFIVVRCVVGVADIDSVAVKEASRRQGIAKRLCAEAIAWSRTMSAETIELEVRASSEGAKALYATLGFTEHGRRRGYYRDPADNAVLMSLPLRP
jgi:ribosomal-protein-alanine N-acetyltransferase